MDSFHLCFDRQVRWKLQLRFSISTFFTNVFFFLFMICWKYNTDSLDYCLIESVGLSWGAWDYIEYCNGNKRHNPLALLVCERLPSKWFREEKVKFCGGCWFRWVASLHSESAVSHLLTLSAGCHSNGARKSGERPGTGQNLLEKHQSHLIVF